ncbi:bacterial regulatory helix-turn-helix, lysR family protein [Burkholderia thailandensis E264]|nr:LysR family transcriptional regulator [Burkholderia thailandensis]AHI72490.1 bacterial regulatory helix-turn-helix, lysR family protein [Burkholderia thailandensis 2002721723]AIP25905.1 bacterial regulatory helix-turn-helix, lysR family protein [Burkholderia thailandensis E264]AJX98156.1 bacterial regulatory helix-turn-helix, lysR family protein [Burkholderia thailandensis 2002721643]PHH37347.1 LysR family transcriptional regulator [Burkholderia thailandensis]
MFDWENLRHFLAVARVGTLSGAARELGADHATVGRRVTMLETELQTRLVERFARHCTLTGVGRRMFEIASTMEAGAFAIERTVQAERSQLTGMVVVSAPPVLVTNFFAKETTAFRERYPGIQLALSGQAQSVSLSRREADVAVRLVRPKEADNVVRRIGAMEFALYAARRYPYLQEPARWEFVGYDDPFDDMPQQRWLKKVAGKRAIACRLGDITSQYAATRAGAGIGMLPRFLPAASDDLVELDVDAEPFARDIWLVVHRQLKASPPIRAVMDFIAERVQRTPALQRSSAAAR